MAHFEQVLVLAEPFVVLLAVIAFLRSGTAKRLPALTTYLALRGSSAVFFNWILAGGGMPQCGTSLYTIYFYSYWIYYIAAAVSLFFAVQEVFDRVMEPVPGLRRLGLLAFRWVCIVSLIVAVGAVGFPAAIAVAGRSASFATMVGPIGVEMMRCADILELCILAFLALSIHALGRSFRSRLFGVALGFGIQASTELVFAALNARYPGMTSSSALFEECGILLALCVWIGYFLVPQPQAEGQIVVLPPQSMLARWNSLANGLGQSPQVAPAQPATGFFLQDIEGVVERVLAKNPIISSR